MIMFVLKKNNNKSFKSNFIINMNYKNLITNFYSKKNNNLRNKFSYKNRIYKFFDLSKHLKFKRSYYKYSKQFSFLYKLKTIKKLNKELFKDRNLMIKAFKSTIKFIKKNKRIIKNKRKIKFNRAFNLAYLSKLNKLNKFMDLNEYHLPIINKFINNLMQDGKKTIAEKIFYNIIKFISLKKKKPLIILKKAFRYSMPLVELKSMRKRGRTLQIPRAIKIFRQSFLTRTWLLESYKNYKQRKNAIKQITEELLQSAKNKGKIQDKIKKLYKTVQENIIYMKHKKKKKE